MKKLLLGGLIMLFSHISEARNVVEIVTTKFKKEISFEEQKKLMGALSLVVQELEGFKSREYYYSEERNVWTDFVVWENLELAKKASDQAMKSPQASSVFLQMDEKETTLSYYRLIGSI